MQRNQNSIIRIFFSISKEKHYLCALKMTITLFLTKIVTEYKLKKNIQK